MSNNAQRGNESIVDPTLRALQYRLGEVIAVLSLEIVDKDWLTGDMHSRAVKKHDTLVEALRLAKQLEKGAKNE